MNVLPTLDGGLCILPQSDSDWAELELICQDVGRPAHLAESLADLMDEDSDWEEYVVPDLEETFNGQCRFVAAAIEHARDSNEAAIFISPKQAEKWYGAINQARLALQAMFKLDKLDDVDDVEEMPVEWRSAYFRDRFYLFLQSMILEHLMDAPQ